MRPAVPWLSAVVALLIAAASPEAAGFSPADSPPDVAVSRRTAERLALRVGQVIEVAADPHMRGARRVRVSAIYDPVEHPADVARGEPVLRFHFPTLEALLGRPDTVDRVIIRLRDAAPAQAIRDDLNALGAGYEAYTAADLTRRTSRTFVVISRFHRAIAVITLLTGAIFLITIMTLKVTEMRREIGALRLMGVGTGTIRLTILLIAAAVGVLGTAAGVAVGAGLVWAINAYYQPLFQTSLRFAELTLISALSAATLAVALGVASGAVVAARLLRHRPLDLAGR